VNTELNGARILLENIVKEMSAWNRQEVYKASAAPVIRGLALPAWKASPFRDTRVIQPELGRPYQPSHQ